jgi:type III pantothenate kinase
MKQVTWCFDVGNTRTKCWLLNASGDIELDIAFSNNTIMFEIGDYVLREAEPQKMCGVSVYSKLAAELSGLMLAEFNVSIEWLQVSPEYTDEFGVLVNAYKEPHRLGADRWAALLAAQEKHNSCIVVDCGTAMTIDVLMDGKHQGGYIFPGQEMMQNSLFANTDQVRMGSIEEVSLSIGINTMQCVQNAALLSQVAVLEYLSKHYSLPVLITGGNALHVSEFLSVPCDYDANMLLLGLKRYFKISSSC